MIGATDGNMVNLARQIEVHMRAIERLIERVENLNHPRSRQIADAFWQECHQPAWATHVVYSRLCDPSRWETGDFGIRHKAATKAIVNGKKK